MNYRIWAYLKRGEFLIKNDYLIAVYSRSQQLLHKILLLQITF